MSIDKTDTIIIGGGFSGLLAAIHLKGLSPKCRIIVLEKDEYPFVDNTFMILPPLVRQLLKRIAPLNNYKFNEGRFLIFKLADIERDIAIETTDTAVVNYLDFIQMFLQIAQNIGVEVCRNQNAVLVDKYNKQINLSSGLDIAYSNIIEAAGAAASVKKESVLFRHDTADKDIYSYPMQCAYTLEKAEKNSIYKVVPDDEDNLPRSYTHTIKIGDMNSYIDHFIDIHTRYTVISAIYAAEAVFSGKGAKAYYRNMDAIADDIKYSLLVRRLVTNDYAVINTPDFSMLLADTLLFGTPYKMLYEYLKSTIL